MLPLVFIFNPDSDMALANGGTNYLSPRFAEQLTRDLQLLPAWLAPAGALVLAHDVEAAEAWLRAQGLPVEAVDMERLPRRARFVPWGWTPTLRKRLLARGVDAACLPPEQAVWQWRELAHRRTTIAVHRLLRERLDMALPPLPVELDTVEAVRRFARAHPGCYVKSPWSGSGRGVWHVHDPEGHDFTSWVHGAIARCGSVLCEVGQERVMDFAVECECEGGATRVTGYSVFVNDAHNQYSGGLVAPTAVLKSRIAALCPAIDDVTAALVQVLDRLVAPTYTGPLGVDMFIYKVGASLRLNPCVELNLRMTMGHVAAHLGNTLALPKGEARFAIVPPSRVPAGARCLTPVTPATAHVAVVMQRG